MKKRIDLILVEKNIAENLTKAKAMIMAGQIFVNYKLVKKSGEIHNYHSVVKVKDLNSRWVSRGSLKLIFALKKFNINIENSICLDIGASTGGFTDVLLYYKAKKIFAVDVGLNQLHERLKKEKKVINLEKINAKYLDKNIINEPIDLIVCDVSFISVKKVLKPSIKFLKKSAGILVALIKPQFEANKYEVKKGGIITDILVHQRICNEIAKWLNEDCQLKILGIIKSPIKGPKGNIEFLIAAQN